MRWSEYLRRLGNERGLADAGLADHHDRGAGCAGYVAADLVEDQVASAEAPDELAGGLGVRVDLLLTQVAGRAGHGLLDDCAGKLLLNIPAQPVEIPPGWAVTDPVPPVHLIPPNA